MQTIIYPTDLEYADSHANLFKEDFKKEVNNEDGEKVFRYLNKLPDILKKEVEKAKGENPERCRLMIIEVRHVCLQWIFLDHIEYSPANMFLYKIKNELRWYVQETARIYAALPKLGEQPKVIEDEPKNDFLHSTIEDWLYPFKYEKKISDIDYEVLVSALKQYINTGVFPVIKKITIGKVNKKRFGWALNQIYRSAKSDTLPLEYLLFAKENISLFEGDTFDINNYLKSNFYKYFTTETK